MSSTDSTGERSAGNRLVRRRDDRVLAGVAGGVADALGVDVAVIRIAFAVLTLLGGSGILLYLLGWALLPEEGDTDSAAERAMRRVSRMSTGAQIALAAVAVLVITGASPGLFGTISLVAIAAVLLGRRDAVSR
jgi:phage shock protein C